MQKILKNFLEKMRKEQVPCFIFMLKQGEKPKFIEVIVKRPYRYTKPELLKKVPKSYHGIPVKVL